MLVPGAGPVPARRNKRAAPTAPPQFPRDPQDYVAVGNHQHPPAALRLCDDGVRRPPRPHPGSGAGLAATAPPQQPGEPQRHTPDMRGEPDPPGEPSPNRWHRQLPQVRRLRRRQGRADGPGRLGSPPQVACHDGGRSREGERRRSVRNNAGRLVVRMPVSILLQRNAHRSRERRAPVPHQDDFHDVAPAAPRRKSRQRSLRWHPTHPGWRCGGG